MCISAENILGSGIRNKYYSVEENKILWAKWGNDRQTFIYCFSPMVKTKRIFVRLFFSFATFTLLAVSTGIASLEFLVPTQTEGEGHVVNGSRSHWTGECSFPIFSKSPWVPESVRIQNTTDLEIWEQSNLLNI